MNASLLLRNDHLDVWRSALDCADPELADQWALLSAQERERAARFTFENDRRHYVAARGTLRRLLGSYTGRPPAEIEIQLSHNGKPALRGAGEWQFNVAHSHGLALFAMARARRVGVDLEWMRPIGDVLALAQSICSAHELAVLCALPDDDMRVEAFYTCWTRKEAYVKARGDGVGLDLRRFTVSMSPDAAALLAVERAIDDGTHWMLGDIQTDPGYLAAFAIERS